MNTNIIKVRFCGSVSLREYTYFTPETVAVGDIVVIEVRGDKQILGEVTAINVPADAIASFKDKMKTIMRIYVEEVEDFCVRSPGCECPECRGGNN